MKSILTTALLLIISITSIAQTGSQPVQVTDLTLIKQLGSVSISHDGTRVIYTINAILDNEEIEGEYTYRSQIYMSLLDKGKNTRALTSGISGASQPAWSPDDQRIAFVRSVKNKSQIFVMDMAGGEPIQITDYKYGANAPKWSPDGKKLLFSTTLSLNEMLKDTAAFSRKTDVIWPLEKPGFSQNENLRNTAKPNPNGSIEQIRSYLDKNESDKKAKVFTNLNFQGESATDPELKFNHYYVVDATPGSKPRALTSGFYSYGSAEFSADGNNLILVSNIDSLLHPDRSEESEIYSLNVKSGNLKKILSQKKIRYSNPVLSPSGNWLSYVFSPTTGINVPKLALLKITEKGAKSISIPFDRSAGSFKWSADERFLYFTAQSNGGAPLYRLNMKTMKVEQLSNYESGTGSYDISKNKLVYVKTEVQNPYEIYSADLSNKSPQELTSFNSEWIKNKRLSFPEKKSYINSKGMTVEYWIMKPAGFNPDNRYPVVLQMHGGPSAMWGPGESSMWHEFQYFCSQGYGVIYANPRGSGGYGEEFLRGNYRNWGQGPTEDVLGALDGAVAEGWADQNKLTITGGSYAGYLTAWIIAHDKRFAAASAQRGVYDLKTFFGEGNAWQLVPNYFGGFPWQDDIDVILKRESPLTYVNQINTPFLIFHGENDLRTGVIQSEMLYKSLKVQGKTVEYVRHPGGTHELVRSGNVRQRIDQMLRIFEFFERYIN
ncbi:S9 family peptidase [Daejeonella oryzae]|uniref:S9 family peptidase n=1 Tax=Daejeonella oryzae TaxID=1122943 RepID=UPI00047E5A04|nr:S9 family peptidase [Daejeonella oryzae]